jgi:hypothetical protein
MGVRTMKRGTCDRWNLFYERKSIAPMASEPRLHI